MSLSLRIENMASLPDGGPLAYTLTGQRGADIGRDPHLDWTLPDPTRHVSGTHCEIRYQDGGYMLSDVSSNGTFLNGGEQRVQSPYRLKSGDRLTIGDYIIAVEVSGEVVTDPMSYAGPTPAFQDLWTIEAAAPPMDPRDFRPPADGKPVQPDFLEWAVDVPNAPGVGFVARPSGQTPTPQQDVWTVPQDTAPAVPKPRRSIWVSPAPSGPWGGGSAAEREPELNGPAAAPSPPEPEAARPLPAAAAPEPVRDAEPEPIVRPEPPAVQPIRPAEPPQPRPMPQPQGFAQQGLAQQDLLASFLKGANVPAQVVAGQDGAAVMERLGRIVLQVTTSVKQLLEARSQSKRLAGSSSHTMIAALDNNPLKFSPTAADALRMMLGGESSSYLDAEQAFRQSFDDLKSHQVKVLSAMQMALEKLVEDLDPKQIEEAVGDKKGPSAWMGFGRAQAWTIYEQRWRSKKSRHGGGLRELFMEYFAECYDQITPGAQK